MEVILLTRSGKNGGACVAGIDTETRRFVRFVRDPGTAKEIPFSDIKGLKALDLVTVSVKQRCPIGPQSENVLVPRYAFRKTGSYSGSISELCSSISYPNNLSLLDTTENRLERVDHFQHSLELVLVRDLVLKKHVKYDNSITTRAFFTKGNRKYANYRVTDLQYDLRKGQGETLRIPCAALVLSIPIKTYSINGTDMGYYKFIASIFPLEETPTVTTAGHEAGRQLLTDAVPETPRNSYAPWKKAEDWALIKEFYTEMSVAQMAAAHKRSEGAILSRLKKLGFTK